MSEITNPFLDERVLHNTAIPAITEHKDITEHKGSKAHLWKPGQSGNPGGRRKTKLITDAILTRLETQGDKDLVIDNIIETLKDRQSKSYSSVLSQVWDRAEGKVPVNLGIDDETKDFLTGNHIAKLMIEAREEQKRLTDTQSKAIEEPQDTQQTALEGETI